MDTNYPNNTFKQDIFSFELYMTYFCGIN